MAASKANGEPSGLAADEDIFHLYLRRSMGYGKLIKAVDLQRLDMGIAMSHFELTARELGLRGRWEKRSPSMSPLPERTEYVQSWIGS